MTALGSLMGLVVLDEVQRRPEIFPVLRVLADRRPIRTRFLILGSASPDLLRQSSETLAGEAVPEADPDDVRELLNYRRAFDLVSKYLDSGAPVSEGLVREIHKRLVEGVRGGQAAPGEYRRVQNYVVNGATGETIYTPPPAHDVPVQMAEMVA